MLPPHASEDSVLADKSVRPARAQKGQAGAAAQAFKLMDGAGSVNRAERVPEVLFMHFRIRKTCTAGIGFEQGHSLARPSISWAGLDFIPPPAL